MFFKSIKDQINSRFIIEKRFESVFLYILHNISAILSIDKLSNTEVLPGVSYLFPIKVDRLAMQTEQTKAITRLFKVRKNIKVTNLFFYSSNP